MRLNDLSEEEKSRMLKQLEGLSYEDLTEKEKNNLVSLSKLLKDLNYQVTNVWPEQHRMSSELLLRYYGWHIRLSMAYNDLIPFIIKNDESLNEHFIKSLKKSLKGIRRLAVKRFPHRKRAIELAFQSHRRREYELSIPAFMILSEGIFREMWGNDMFTKKKKEREEFLAKLKANEKSVPLLSSAIEGVINGDIIALSFAKDDDLKLPNVLHRNRILHGADIGYGTQMNAYKAISQFEFVICLIYIAYKGDNSLLEESWV